MATDGSGGNPTDLSGVTFIGGPRADRKTYHIRRSTGKVLGPFDPDLIVQMVRGQKLSGDEDVSVDRDVWEQIRTVEPFASAFDALPPGGGPAALPPLAEGAAGRPVSRTVAGGPFRLDELLHPPSLGSAVSAAAPVPYEDEATQLGGTGSWAALDDEVEETVDSVVAPRDVASEVAGVRRITAAMPPTPMRTASELPMPAGFTNFPLGGDGPGLPTSSGPPPSLSGGPPSLGGAPRPLPGAGLPQGAPPSLAGVGTRSLSPAGATLQQQLGPGTLEMPADELGLAFGPSPSRDGGRATGALDDLPGLRDPGADLPASRHVDLPTSARGMTDLPALSRGVADLPRSAMEAADLPRSTLDGLDYPQSARGVADLPASLRDIDLPTRGGQLPAPSASVWDLPASSAELPQRTGVPQFGTMAMSGLSADLPRSAGVPSPLGASSGAPGPSVDLPASARGAGTSVLDSMAQTDDIWSAPDSPIRASADDLRASNQFGAARSPRTEANSIGVDPSATAASPLSRPTHDPFATEPIAAPTWADKRAASASLPLADEGFGDFFPGADADDGGPDLPSPAQEALPEPEFEAPAPKKKKSAARGREWGLRIGLVVILLVVLTGAALLLRTLAAKRAASQEETVVAAVEARPVVVIEVPPIESLNLGGYRNLVDYVDVARTAVGDRGDVADRASFLYAGSLMLAEYPEHGELFAELRRNFNALADAPDDASAPLVALARAAFLAATAGEGAEEAIAAARSGSWQAQAEMLAAVYDIQFYRGVEFGRAAEPEEAPAAAEGSGDGSGESGEGSAEAEAPAGTAAEAPAAEEAPAEEEPAEEEPVAAAPAVEEPDDEGEGSGAVVVQPRAEVRTLNPRVRESLARAVELADGLVSAHYWRGWVELELDDATKAAEHFETAIGLNPEHVGAEIGVARSFRRAGRLRDADARIQRVIDDLEAVSSKGERADTFIVAAEISVARLQPVIAVESLLSALQADPSNTTALRMLGEQFYRSQEFARAIDYFSGAGSRADAREAAIGKAMAEIGLERFAAARETLEAGATRYATDARFPLWLGVAYEGEAEFELSRQYYRQAMQIDPTDVRPVVRLALLAARERKPGDALRLLDEAVAVRSQDAASWNAIGEMYLRIGETNRAVSAFREALRIDQSEPDARMNLAQYYLDSDQQTRALDLLGTMIEAGIEAPRVRYLNARALLGQRAFDRAVEELLVLQEAEPRNAEYLFLMGRVHFEAGNFLPARAQFVRAWEEAPTMEAAQYYIGRTDLELGQYNEAITSLTSVAHRSPRGDYHYYLGVALEKGGQPAAALAEYDTTVNGDIAWSLENPEVFTRRGRLYFMRGALSAAYRDLRTALVLRPASAEAAYLLGRVHYDDRRYDDAIASFDSAIAIDDVEPRAHYFAALAYLRFAPPRLAAALPHLETARDAGFGADTPDALQKLAYVYRDLGRFGDAADALDAFIQVANLPYDERREMENEARTLRGRR